MKNIYLFIITFVTIFSCTSNQPVTLKYDHNVHEIFNREEISNLDMIVNFFDSVIIENTKEQDVNQAYHEYFEKISTSEYLEDLKTCVGLANSNDAKALIEKLKDREIFNEIWEYSYGYKYKSNDTLSLRLSLNLQGKYFQLLELLRMRNDFIKEYTSSLQSSGYINPSLVASVMKDYNKDIDFKKAVNRLIWAVHYITILSEETVIK